MPGDVTVRQMREALESHRMFIDKCLDAIQRFPDDTVVQDVAGDLVIDALKNVEAMELPKPVPINAIQPCYPYSRPVS